MPKPLIVYAKKEGIRLFTHGDESDILPEHTLRSLLSTWQKQRWNGSGSDGSDESDEERWRPKWVVKYTAVARERGVVESKGYIVMASSL